MMPGDGSRPAVVYVGMFRTALSEQKGWVTPSCLPNFILIPDRKPDHRDIHSSHGSIRFVIPSWSGDLYPWRLDAALAVFVSVVYCLCAPLFSACLCCSCYLVCTLS